MAIIIDGDPWFNAMDVCAILGYGNHRQAIESHVDEDDVQKLDAIDSLGRTQQANHVDESGVYALIFGSTKPEAKRFKRWLTAEVLPALRKTGRYETAPLTPSREEPLNFNHRADILVAADRTFRAVMRSGRMAGLPLPTALRRANEITLDRTGLDMLDELGVDPEPSAAAPESSEVCLSPHPALREFAELWLAGALPVPAVVRRRGGRNRPIHRRAAAMDSENAMTQTLATLQTERERLRAERARTDYESDLAQTCTKQDLTSAGRAIRARMLALVDRIGARMLEADALPARLPGLCLPRRPTRAARAWSPGFTGARRALRGFFVRRAWQAQWAGRAGALRAAGPVTGRPTRTVPLSLLVGGKRRKHRFHGSSVMSQSIQSAAAPGRKTHFTRFFTCNANQDALFSVNAGLPADEALEQAACFLASALSVMNEANVYDDSSSGFAALYLVEMAQAVVNSAISKIDSEEAGHD